MSSRAGDPYLDPASGVLRNLLGITDAAGLARAEAALSASRLIDLERRRLPASMPSPTCRLSTAAFSATSTPGPGSCAPCPSRKDRCSACRSTWSPTRRTCSAGWPPRSGCGAWPATRSSPGLAGFLADVNALHPFREGNGRAQRAFFSQLAHDAGHHIAWVRMDPDRNTAASAAAHHGDLAPLREMLDQLTDPPASYSNRNASPGHTHISS